jgi:phage terminase Nu1 subunit (DNA packaging protein)
LQEAANRRDNLERQVLNISFPPWLQCHVFALPTQSRLLNGLPWVWRFIEAVQMELINFEALADKTIDVRSLAKLLNLTPRRIQQLVEEGAVERSEHGRYKLTDAILGYVNFLESKEGGGNTANNFARAKASEMASKAELTGLRVARLRRELIPANAVQETWQTLTETFRDRLLTMPDRLAPRLIGIKSRQDAKEIIKRDVLQNLSELSRIEVKTASNKTAG